MVNNLLRVLIPVLLASSAFADEAELKTRIEKLSEQNKIQAEAIHDLQTKTDHLISEKSNSNDVKIGGYGEMGYNRYSQDNSRSIADLKRFVFFLGYRFNDKLSFNSEVEWEHAVTSSTDQGESEIEQAYLNYELGHGTNLKAGLFLMPFGFLNQSHEPPVFYGVERNEVETRIIPSTWREGGFGISGDDFLSLNWDAGITTGFDFAKLDDASSPLHAIHQELQFAKANDPAFYEALNYRQIPGFVFGESVFTGNSGQENADFKANSALPNFAGIGDRITLWDLHTRWEKRGWDLEALYAHGYIGDSNEIDQTIRTFNTANSGSRPLVPSEFYGWLLQASYTVWEKGEQSLSPFARFEQYNTQSKMPIGFSADSANTDRVATLGFSLKPHSQVVVKADYQKFLSHGANDRLNLGLGYMF